MIDKGKHSVLGILVDAVDYDAAVQKILEAARAEKAFGVSALAVHGVMTGVQDKEHLWRLNSLELVVPDGQPVRWALNLLYRVGLADRVYGPQLMLKVCAAAEADHLPVFLYGSRRQVLERLVANLMKRFPHLKIAGFLPSVFRTLTLQERTDIVRAIRQSGAKIVFVGLGCPRQEIFVYEMRELLSMPVIAVGAAFDFHAGFLREAPLWMQRWGLQWFHRLLQEPDRLWRRYLVLGPAFVGLFLLQLAGLWKPEAGPPLRPREICPG